MLDSYRDLIDELLGTPQALRERIGQGAVTNPATLGLVAQLRDRDQAVLARLQTMLKQSNAMLSEWKPPETVAPAEDADVLLRELDAARSDLISLLVNLTLKDWERTATHAIDGEITLAEEVERHVEFDEEMVARIEAAR